MKSFFYSKRLAAVLAASLLAASAYATQPGNNGGGNGGCGVGQQTNGCGGQGGAGGAGGAGGKGVGVGVGIAAAQANAAAIAAQSTSVRTTNRNANSVTGTNSNQLNAGSSYSQSGGNVLHNEGSRVTVEGDKGSTYYAPAQERNPVATAYAAPLAAANGTCMGSTSGGAQGAAIGVTFGTTWTDSKCDARYDAEALRAVAGNSAAIARLCQVKELRQAIEDSGQTCPTAKAKVATNATPVMMPVVSEQTASAQYQDPIIRARLGLPPLK